MNFGVHVVNARPWATAEWIVSLGTRAEALGFDSLWVSDQIVIPSEVSSSFTYGTTGTYDIEANQNFFEALSVLSYLAGRTTRVKLGTSVLVLPYRQPLVVRHPVLPELQKAVNRRVSAACPSCWTTE